MVLTLGLLSSCGSADSGKAEPAKEEAEPAKEEGKFEEEWQKMQDTFKELGVEECEKAFTQFVYNKVNGL